MALLPRSKQSAQTSMLAVNLRVLETPSLPLSTLFLCPNCDGLKANDGVVTPEITKRPTPSVISNLNPGSDLGSILCLAAWHGW